MSGETKTLKHLLRESFSLFTGNIVIFLKLTLAAYLPLTILYLFLFSRLSSIHLEPRPDLALALQALLWVFIFLTVAVTLLLIYQAAILRATDLAYRKEKVEFVEIWRWSSGVFWAYSWVVLIASVKIFLWSLLLIIPGIIFAIFYSGAGLAFVVDMQRGNHALIYSKNVIKPSVWRFIGNMIVVGIIVAIVYYLIRGLELLIFGNMNPENMGIMTVAGYILGSITTALISIYPTVYMYFLYQEMKQAVQPVSI